MAKKRASYETYEEARIRFLAEVSVFTILPTVVLLVLFPVPSLLGLFIGSVFGGLFYLRVSKRISTFILSLCLVLPALATMVLLQLLNFAFFAGLLLAILNLTVYLCLQEIKARYNFESTRATQVS